MRDVPVQTMHRYSRIRTALKRGLLLCVFVCVSEGVRSFLILKLWRLIIK